MIFFSARAAIARAPGGVWTLPRLREAKFAAKRKPNSEGPRMKSRFAEAMAKLPLVAILRGIAPAESPAILRALLAEGFLPGSRPRHSA